jgi:hypothetical protein
MRRFEICVAVWVCICTARSMAAPCGLVVPCVFTSGTYRVALPSGRDERTPLPVLMSLRGPRGDGAGFLSDAAVAPSHPPSVCS